MAVQPFVGPWPISHFHNPIQSRYDSLDGGSARRKAATYKQDSTNRINTDIHATSEIRTYDPSIRAGEDISCLRPRDHCDRPLNI
jgi:hypothetical protein